MRVEHRHQGLPEAVDVEEGAGLLAEAKLAPGQHLEHFVQRAETAGQGDEPIGQLEHPRLARMHGIDDFEAGDAAMGDFPVDQLLRDHADDLTAVRQHGVRDDAHQADVAAAVHQGDAVSGEACAECFRLRGVSRIVAGIGTAVDADRFHVAIIVLETKRRAEARRFM
jgi:hypothetical protein